MNQHPSYLKIFEDRGDRSSSSSSGSGRVEPFQTQSFQPINQAPPVWANTERLPPSPIQTTSSFDRYTNTNSPLPLRNLFDQRGGGEVLPHPADNFAFEGFPHDQHNIDRPGVEREDTKQLLAGPSPSAFSGGFHAVSSFHQIPHQSYEDHHHPPFEPSHNPFVSHHHMVYRFEPQYLPSTWHAMYKPTEMDRKPAPSYSPNRPAISPVKHPGAPPFFAHSPPAASAPLPPIGANVPPVASRDPESYTALHNPSTRAAAVDGSPPSPALSSRARTARRSKKARGGRRESMQPERQHAHESPSTKELEDAPTNRARKAIHSWYTRYNELVDYANKFGDTAVPQQYEDNHALGIWVNKQRMEMKAFADQGRTSMTQRRMQLLEKIDFEWAKPKGVAAWDQKFRELQEYKAIHGDCHVPTKHKGNRPLGRWVSTQRNMKKNYDRGITPKSLDHEEICRRINLLEGIGFAWSMVESPTSIGSS